jgi:hypothetical protein
MMSKSTEYQVKRQALARIARHEGSLAVTGNAHLAGDAIEKYLAVFRDAFNSNGNYTKYTDRRIGYPWCCAFVYYCCLRAGFTFPPKPITEHRWTLGAVPAWYDWAILPQNNFYFAADDRQKTPQPGDIVLFDHLIEDRDLDHIGIIVAVKGSVVVTAEGNVYNKSGVFERPLGLKTNGYIRLAGF